MIKFLKTFFHSGVMLVGIASAAWTGQAFAYQNVAVFAPAPIYPGPGVSPFPPAPYPVYPAPYTVYPAPYPVYPAPYPVYPAPYVYPAPVWQPAPGMMIGPSYPVTNGIMMVPGRRPFHVFPY